MKLTSLAGSSAAYAAGNLASRIVGFLMIPVYTRFLTTSDYGTIELLERLMFYVTLVLGIEVLGEAMVRIAFDRDEEEGWRETVVSSAFGSMIVLSVTGMVAGVFLSPWLAGWFLEVPSMYRLMQVYFAAMATGALSELGRVYLRLSDRPLHFLLFSLAYLAVNAGLSIYLIVFAGQGIWGFVWSKILTTSLGTLYMLVLVTREVGWHFSTDALGRMLRFGAPLILMAGAAFTIHFSDRFFLNAFKDLSTIGIYSLAYNFGLLVTALVGLPFRQAWGVRLYAHAREEGWQRHFSKVLSYLLFLLLFVWLGLAFFTTDALAVMSAPEFHSAAAFVPLIAASYVLRELGEYHRLTLFIRKRSVAVTSITATSALVNLLLNYLLIRPYGAWGAAASTVLTWGLYMSIMWRLAQREHRLPLPYAAMARLTGLAGGAYAASLLASGLPTLPRWGVLGALTLLFPLLAWVTGYFDAEQRREIGAGLQALWERLRAGGGGRSS